MYQSIARTAHFLADPEPYREALQAAARTLAKQLLGDDSEMAHEHPWLVLGKN